MVRTEIHIPTISNEGRPFGADAFKITDVFATGVFLGTGIVLLLVLTNAI